MKIFNEINDLVAFLVAFLIALACINEAKSCIKDF